MYLLDLFRTKSRRRETSPAPEQSPQEQGSAVRSGLVMTGAGIWDSAATMPMKVATVYRCVELLSGIVSSLPLRYMRREGGVMTEFGTSPLTYLLQVMPMSGINARKFWRQVMRRILLRGNAHIFPRMIGGECVELVLLTGAVSHDKLNHTYTVSDVLGGVYGTFREDEIIHLTGMSDSDGRDGVSVLTYAANAIGISATGDGETLKRFQTGGVRGLLSNERSVSGFGEYADKELEKAARDLTYDLQAGGIASVPGKVSFTPLGLNSADLQFLENKKFTVREICRFFGVHPSFVFDDTSNNYKSAETANVAFLSMTLNPLLGDIEAELNCKLIPRTLSQKRCFLFDREGLYAMDTAGKSAYIKSTIENGIYTVNDWRLKENQPPVEGGDIPMRSANLVPLASGFQEPAKQEDPEPNNQEPNDKEDNE